MSGWTDRVSNSETTCENLKLQTAKLPNQAMNVELCGQCLELQVLVIPRCERPLPSKATLTRYNASRRILQLQTEI